MRRIPFNWTFLKIDHYCGCFECKMRRVGRILTKLSIAENFKEWTSGQFAHPISTFDVGWQPEILSPIARLPAGLYYSILSPQNMRAFQRTGSRILSNEKLPQSHSISSLLLNLAF